MKDPTRFFGPLPAPKTEAHSTLRSFRTHIGELASTTEGKALVGINFGALSEEDMVFFHNFEKGRFSLTDIERQEQVLDSFQEAAASKQLLAYMKRKLRE